MNSGKESKAISIACASEANVLLTGPTGSGKTRLARRIHDRGPRAAAPFVAINLATLHEGVIESELFGHERGAFTSADTRRVGKLELAHGGTVFLDEIGELPPRLQARLLEVLQSGVITPVGGNREVKLDLRVIAATHRDLDAAVASGAFREDLFHRVRVISIPLRSLAERGDEFDRILHECLADVCARAGRSILRVNEGTAHALEAHDWPGNFRELRNVLEYSVLASDGNEICVSDLPGWFGERKRTGAAALAASDTVGDVENSRAKSGSGAGGARGIGRWEIEFQLSYERSVAIFEKEYFSRVLARYGWRVSRAARAIGISKATLLRRIRALDLKSPLRRTELEDSELANQASA